MNEYTLLVAAVTLSVMACIAVVHFVVQKLRHIFKHGWAKAATQNATGLQKPSIVGGCRMKVQVNIALILGLLFIVWLFLWLAIDVSKFKAPQHNWTVVSHNIPGGMTYLVDRNTGASWRWYRTYKKNSLGTLDQEIESEGWTPVVYKVVDWEFSDATTAQPFATVVADANRQAAAQQQKEKK